MQKQEEFLWKNNYKRILGVIFAGIVLAFLVSGLADQQFMRDVFHHITGKESLHQSLWSYTAATVFGSFGAARWMRMELFFLGFLFLGAHVVFPLQKLYEWLFRYRFLLVGLLFAFMVLNGFHGDSLTCYDYTIQNKMGSDLVYPLIGKERSIRSDEWLVNTPGMLKWLLNGDGVAFPRLVNGITEPSLYLGWLVYKVFGAVRYYSFIWYFPIFTGAVFTFEFFRMFTKDKRLVSMLLTLMIYMSSYIQWWNTSVLLMLSIHGTLLFFWLNFDQKVWWKRALCLYLTAVCFLKFVRILYPAWQVPFGYVALLLGVWIIWQRREEIASMSKETKLLMGAAAVFMVVVLGIFIRQNMGYFHSITTTVYPGNRVSCGGGVYWYKLFGYIPGIVFPFVSSDVVNASENSMFITLFPLPFLWLFYHIYKKKRMNGLLVALLVLSVFYFVYAFVGVPRVLAIATVMGWSTSARTLDAFGYVQMILMAALIRDGALLDSEESKKRLDVVKLVFAMALSALGCYLARAGNSGISSKFYIVMFLVFAVVFYLASNMRFTKERKWFSYSLIMVCFLTGFLARPICYGFDAITSKPLYGEIRLLQEQENREQPNLYLAYDSLMMQSYLTACGVGVVNYVNTVPNTWLYTLLDAEGKYEEIWNRYEHVRVVFTGDEKTSFELVQADTITIHLAKKDLVLTDTNVIVSEEALHEKNKWFTLKPLYEEGDAYVYRVVYTKKAKAYQDKRVEEFKKALLKAAESEERK